MQSRTYMHLHMCSVQYGTMEIAAVPGWYLAEERKDAGPFFFSFFPFGFSFSLSISIGSLGSYCLPTATWEHE